MPSSSDTDRLSLVRAFAALVRVDGGFSSEKLVSFRLSLRDDRLRSREAVNAVSAQFRSRLAALPGVTGVGAISHLPYDELPKLGDAVLA